MSDMTPAKTFIIIIFHVDSDVIKKASKRLYFLVQLKRSRVPRQDMSTFYTACIRSVLTYAATVLFLRPAKVPKRRVGACRKAGHVYNMLRTTLPGGHRTSEHCPHCRFHHGAMH